MSEPLKPEEVVKFGDQMRKLFGWVKKLFGGAKKTATIIAICILPLVLTACETVRAIVRVVNSIPIPEPNPRPTEIPTPFPNPIPTSTPTRTPNVVYTPTPSPVPTVTPTPFCIPRPSNEPVGLNFCTKTDIELPFRDEITHSGALCGLNYGVGNANTAWRLGYGLAKQGMRVAIVNGKRLQFNEGRGYTDKLGRYFPDGMNIYVHPEGESAPYTWGGYLVPPFCEDQPSIPVPTATPGPINASCEPVVNLEHFMAPGDHCHQWDWDGNQIKCLVDSTIRPICDMYHMENWNTFCGQRFHDPDYEHPIGEQNWSLNGSEGSVHFHGPNKKNYAQMWIKGNPGAFVNVTVCIKSDAVTPDGCKITRRGDGCGERKFNLPSGN